MKQAFRFILAWLFLGFLVVFFGRLLFLVFFTPPKVEKGGSFLIPTFSAEPGMLMQAKASSSYSGGVTDNDARQLTRTSEILNLESRLQTIATDVQTARVLARWAVFYNSTTNFEGDSAIVKGLIEKFQMEISMEERSGLSPRQYWNLKLRIPRDNFEAATQELRKVGRLDSFEITTEDRTEETKRAFAEAQALSNLRESLTRLRQQVTKVDEAVALETKLSDAEARLGNLQGQVLGGLAPTRMANISFSLREIETDKPATSIEAILPWTYLSLAFIWSVEWYSLVVFAVALVIAGVLAFRVALSPKNQQP